MSQSLRTLLAGACLLAAAGASHAQTQKPAVVPSVAIVNVRIFDGSQVIPRGTVVVQGDRIAAVGPDVQPPAGAQMIDAAGATLLPGLIDGHTHAFGDALVRALQFGVTTELDMFTVPEFAKAMRDEQEKTGAPERADLKSAGILATAPGGHGTQYGIPVPTLTKPEEAPAWVDARIAEGSDYIKIIWEDGSVQGRSIPSLDRATVAALIKAAHQRGKLAVVHASTQPNARAAIEDGADGLVHIFSESAPEPGFVALVAERKAFVIPTVTVIEGTGGGTGGSALAADPRVAPYLRPEETANLRNSSKPPGSKRNPAFSVEAVRQLHAAGVPIVAGSDAPNRGTTHGASIHREMEILVQAGLTPAQALAAATSVAAKVFHLEDRGRIAPGLKADLLLVEGDPTADILATRNLLRIWKSGREVERRKVEASAPPPRPEIPASGLVSDFEGDSLSATFGSGWMASTDGRMGGKSVVESRIVAGGAPEGGSPGKSLEVSGEIRPGAQRPWAGVMFSPGPAVMAPADLSAVKAIAFWAKGDGGTYSLLLFAGGSGVPAQRPFVAGPDWQRHVIPLADFQGADAKNIAALFWGAGGKQGPFRFQIDGVTLEK